jgi:hypothetical protein
VETFSVRNQSIAIINHTKETKIITTTTTATKRVNSQYTYINHAHVINRLISHKSSNSLISINYLVEVVAKVKAKFMLPPFKWTTGHQKCFAFKRGG